jgi:CHAD domain-containing protein
MDSNVVSLQNRVVSISSATALTVQRPLHLAQIIAFQLVELQNYYRTVMENTSVEAIHKMRVTTRRLQASLELINFKEDKAGIGKVREQLRTLRQMVSEVRNYDVFLILLEQEAATHKAMQGPFESLIAELEKRREKKAKEMKRFLRKHSIKKIAAELGVKLQKPEKASLHHIASNEKILKRTASRLEKRLTEFQQLAAEINPTKHPEEIHQLRIAAKRLRYLLEIAADMGYGQSLTALNWLRTLQDRIGDWHDLEAIEDEIINIVGHREFIKERLRESSLILMAAVHFHKRKLALVHRLFPITVNRSIDSATQRIVQNIRRDIENDVY